MLPVHISLAQDLTVKDSPVDASFRGAGAAYHSRIEKLEYLPENW